MVKDDHNYMGILKNVVFMSFPDCYILFTICRKDWISPVQCLGLMVDWWLMHHIYLFIWEPCRKQYSTRYMTDLLECLCVWWGGGKEALLMIPEVNL